MSIESDSEKLGFYFVPFFFPHLPSNYGMLRKYFYTMNQIFASSGPHQIGWESLDSNLINVTLLIKSSVSGMKPKPLQF